jgi:sec-independent protein translocase protein TatA
MAPTWLKLLVVVALIVVLFGKGRIAEMMGDFGKGIKNFKKVLRDDGPEDNGQEQPARPAVGQDAVDRLAASLKDRDTPRAR